MSLFCTETEKLLSAGWYYIWLWLMLHFQSTIMSTRSVWFIFKAFGAFSNANSLIWIKSLNSSYLLFNHSDFSNSIFNGNQWQIQQSRRVDQRGHCHLTYHNLSRKPWQKTCLMHFALWESCSFFLSTERFACKLKLPWCRTATGIIILYALEHVCGRRVCSWAWILWAGDNWNALHEYEFLTVPCILKQLDSLQENSEVIGVPVSLGVWTWGTNVEERGVTWIKAPLSAAL